LFVLLGGGIGRGAPGECRKDYIVFVVARTSPPQPGS
jgi:hypothetical protein